MYRTLGIGADHEHGVDPNTEEQTAWIRLTDGSVAYLDLAPLDRASGRYRRDNMSIIHPDDSAYAAFVPASDFDLAI